jgi:integrase
MLQRVCEGAGIDRRRFHALRHSSALDALDAGISVDKVQRQLGHANLQTTLNYLRGRDEDRARAYRECSLSKSLAERAAIRQAMQKDGAQQNQIA